MSLIIRIIGGVFGGAIGTYVSGKIYDHFNKKPTIMDKNIPDKNVNKDDQTNKEEYLQLKIENDIYYKNMIKPKEDDIYINDAIYDNTYFDFYMSLGK